MAVIFQVWLLLCCTLTVLCNPVKSHDKIKTAGKKSTTTSSNQTHGGESSTLTGTVGSTPVTSIVPVTHEAGNHVASRISAETQTKAPEISTAAITTTVATSSSNAYVKPTTSRPKIATHESAAPSDMPLGARSARRPPPGGLAAPYIPPRQIPTKLALDDSNDEFRPPPERPPHGFAPSGKPSQHPSFPPSGPPPPGSPPNLPPHNRPPPDLPPRDLPPRDLPPRDLPPRDLPPRDLPPRDLPPRDLPPRDPPLRDLPPRGLPPPGHPPPAHPPPAFPPPLLPPPNTRPIPPYLPKTSEYQDQPRPMEYYPNNMKERPLSAEFAGFPKEDMEGFNANESSEIKPPPKRQSVCRQSKLAKAHYMNLPNAPLQAN